MEAASEWGNVPKWNWYDVKSQVVQKLHLGRLSLLHDHRIRIEAQHVHRKPLAAKTKRRQIGFGPGRCSAFNHVPVILVEELDQLGTGGPLAIVQHQSRPERHPGRINMEGAVFVK